MGGAEVLQAALAAKGGTTIVGNSGADLEQKRLLAEAEVSVGSYRDGARLEQLAGDEEAAELLAITTASAAATNDANDVIPVVGTGLEGAAYVIIEGGVVVVPTAVTDTGLSFEVPDAINAGTFDVTFVTPQGYITKTDFLVVT
jgi:hypothetical protein